MKIADFINATRRYWRVLLAAIACVVALAVAPTYGASEAALSPVGDWITPDPETGKPRSIVRIEAQGEVLIGRVIKGLSGHDRPGSVCSLCVDDRKGQPLLGMDIIRDARKSESESELQWFGEILDPSTGKSFKLRLRMVDDGKTLELRAYKGSPMFGRTIEWQRQLSGSDL